MEVPFPIRDGRELLGYFDFAWPSLRLIIEVDGFEFHGKREHLRRHCRRHTALARRGWWLLRFTWEDVVAVRDTLQRLSTTAA